MPVLFKLKADGLFFEAGPQIGFLVSANVKIDDASANVKEYYRTTDLGYAAGLGYQTTSGTMVGLRYNGGFSRIGKDGQFGNITVESGKAYNSAFQLYVGYLFGGK